MLWERIRKVPLVLHSEEDCIVIRSEECVDGTASLALDNGTANLAPCTLRL